MARGRLKFYNLRLAPLWSAQHNFRGFRADLECLHLFSCQYEHEVLKSDVIMQRWLCRKLISFIAVYTFMCIRFYYQVMLNTHVKSHLNKIKRTT